METNWKELIAQIPIMPLELKGELLEKLLEDLFIKGQIHPEHEIALSETLMNALINTGQLELEPEELILEKNIPEPRFSNQKWSQIVNRNFEQISEQINNERGKKAKLGRLISENTGLSPRNSERYLDGEHELTAEVLLMFEDVLNIHRDQILGDFISSSSKSNTMNINDIKEFQILYRLMKKNEMLSDDLKKILRDISKVYSDLEIRTRSLSSMDTGKNYELMRKMFTDFIRNLKGITT